MKRYNGGTEVRGGYYYKLGEWELAAVAGETGRLEGGPGQQYVRRFLQAGASGFVLKKASSGLVEAIRAVHRGGLVLDPEVARDAMAEIGRPVPPRAAGYDSLTAREKQVLKLVAEGMSNKEVAGALGISVKTAMAHREHVMVKLDLHNRTDLVRFALRTGVIPQEP